MNNAEAKNAIISGEKLPKPDNMPEEVYPFIEECCWKLEPTEREGFKEILKRTQQLYLKLFGDYNNLTKVQALLNKPQEVPIESPYQNDDSK